MEDFGPKEESWGVRFLVKFSAGDVSLTHSTAGAFWRVGYLAKRVLSFARYKTLGGPAVEWEVTRSDLFNYRQRSIFLNGRYSRGPQKD